ncbi:twin-arginine translocase TatA/TatE family subunit [Siminovitchia sp. FSL H7-0308]|uniref:Sec-independent protein translocase protein TatA n=1 Tax=Siminovitchia thermophila TaxID=1245522 RepID=A0ABS2RE78_9BACI|nr:twin-arginine translocase TatA/TatE family subunit [Siminovitchia thermophila]MBM7717489.1 sec-independent protein translocase protein TatA [Siminovitchia thermophila]ONK22552.1 Sec-independent protein translocase TatA [Bacillus sp. VT-16-64]
MSAGVGSLLVIALVAILIFGPKKLPELGKAAGNTLREFKNATKGLADDDEKETKKDSDK